MCREVKTKTSRLYSTTKLIMQQGREVFLAVPPLFSNLRKHGLEHFHRLFPDSMEFIGYPLVTEEAGLSLKQQPPHWAQLPKSQALVIL